MNGNIDSRIWRATREDVPAIRHLMLRAQAGDGAPRISESEIAALMAHGEIVVLGGEPTELLAAACLTTRNGRGHLTFLVVDPRVPELEARIRSAADGLSEVEQHEQGFALSFRRAS